MDHTQLVMQAVTKVKEIGKHLSAYSYADYLREVLEEVEMMQEAASQSANAQYAKERKL